MNKINDIAFALSTMTIKGDTEGYASLINALDSETRAAVIRHLALHY